jgi:ribulose-5-phosphate 4-epimerase/fuculose-1-phosphate aldolase
LSAVDATTYDVIIFIHNMNLRNVVRDCLKEISGFQILNSESDEQSLEYFQTYPKAWFIHDGSQDPQVLAKTLGKSNVALMRGHGSVTVGTSIKQAVFRGVYTESNARLQSEAMRFGEITFLTEGEAQATSAMNDQHLERPWEMWKRDASR